MFDVGDRVQIASHELPEMQDFRDNSRDSLEREHPWE
jgi:hypothetical protein